MSRRQGERYERAGFTLLELMIIITVISILAVIAFPYLTEARKHAEERSAINTVRVIVTAQLQFKEKFGRFAPSLNFLVAAGLITDTFTSTVIGLQPRGTWEFTTRVPRADTANPPLTDALANAKSRFRVGAQPAGPGMRERLINGDHQYFVLETGVMYVNTLNPSAMTSCDAIIQNVNDAEFGTTFPVVPGL